MKNQNDDELTKLIKESYNMLKRNNGEVYFSKLDEGGIFSYLGGAEIIWDFENLDKSKIKRLASLWTKIKEINLHRAELLARTMYSLQVLPIDVVEKLLYQFEDESRSKNINPKPIYYPQYEYLATIEPASDYRVLFRIYPESIECLPCFEEWSLLPIIPNCRMMIDEAKSILVKAKSLGEFYADLKFSELSKGFVFTSTREFGLGKRSVEEILKRKKFNSLREFVSEILDNPNYLVSDYEYEVSYEPRKYDIKGIPFSLDKFEIFEIAEEILFKRLKLCVKENNFISLFNNVNLFNSQGGDRIRHYSKVVIALQFLPPIKQFLKVLDREISMPRGGLICGHQFSIWRAIINEFESVKNR
jgi:hypothetical protein